MGQRIDLRTVSKIVSLFVLLSIVYIDASHSDYSASPIVYIIVGLIAGADLRDVISQYIGIDKKDK